MRHSSNILSRSVIATACELAIVLVALISSSCERRPLYELSNTHYVRVYIDERIKNVTEGFYSEEHKDDDYKRPEVMRIVFTDPSTGLMKADRYLRHSARDERGLYFDGYVICDPGVYDVMAYNFGTESTLISHPHDYNKATAYTNEIAANLKSQLYSMSKAPVEQAVNEKIVYDPDHLFVAKCKGVEVPYSVQMDTIRCAQGDYFEAESIVLSYYLQVKIKGVKYVSSVVARLDGMAGSAKLTTSPANYDDKVSIYYNMDMVEVQNNVGKVYTTFGTFGRIPSSQNPLTLTFDFMTTYGKPYTETIVITDVFETKPAIENQWLFVEHEIVIPDPPKPTGGGGFNPGVGEWNDVHTDIVI